MKGKVVLALLGLLIVSMSLASAKTDYDEIATPTRADLVLSTSTPTAGDTVTAATSLQYYDGIGETWKTLIFSGTMKHLLLDNMKSHGGMLHASEQQVSLGDSITVEMISSLSMSGVRLIKVPVLGLSNYDGDSTIEISILDSSDTFLLGFQLLPSEMEQMITDYQAILLGVGTHAEWESPPVGSTLNLNSFKVRMLFSGFPAASLLTLPAISSGADAIADGMPIQDTSVSIYSGSFLGQTYTNMNGQHSIDVVAPAGEFYYYSVYGDEVMMYQRCFLFTSLVGSDSLSVQIDNMSLDYGSQVTLSAQVTQTGPVQGAMVEFRHDYGGPDDLLGTAITNAQGVAILQPGDTVEVGVHTISVQASHDGHKAYDSAFLTVQKQQAFITALQASGIYLSASPSETEVTVSGYLLYNGIPLSEEDISISDSIGQLGVVTTDQSGYFELVYQDTYLRLTYPNEITASYVGDTWLVNDGIADLVINRADPVISIGDATAEYDTGSVHIAGSTTNIHASPLDLTGELKRFDGNNWVLEGSYSSLSGSLSIDHPMDLAGGVYLYRFISQQTDLYESATADFTVTISPANAFLSLVGNEPHAYYREQIEVQVYLNDSAGNPVANELVRFYYEDLSYNEIHIGEILTDSGGIASMNWTPTDHMSLPDGRAYMLVYLQSDNYLATAAGFHFSWEATPISMNVITNEATHGQVSTITIDLVDFAGSLVEDGLAITVQIEGTNYELVTAGGKVQLSHTFLGVGNVDIHVLHTKTVDGLDSHYADCDLVDTIMVDKASYSLVVDPAVADQGGLVTLSATLSSNGQPAPGVSASLEVHNGISWQSVGTVVSALRVINAGQPDEYYISVLEYDYLNTLAPRSYAFRYSIAEGVTHLATTHSSTMEVENIIGHISISAPTDYDYGSIASLRTVTISYKVSGTSLPLASKPIEVTFGEKNYQGTTDAQGEYVVILPVDQLPGSYELLAEVGNDPQLVYTSGTVDITVNGLATYLFWEMMPSNTYYGEALQLSVRAEDASTNLLIGFEITVQAGGQTFIGYTNEQGIYTLDTPLRGSTGTIDVTIELQAQPGYNPATISSSISHEKKILDLAFSSTLGTSTIYDTAEVYTLQITDPVTGLLVPGIQVELYYLDTDYVLFGSYTSLDGTLSISIARGELPLLEARSYYQFRLQLGHNDYQMLDYDHSILIEEGQMDVLVEIISGYYGEDIEVIFTVSNSNGETMAADVSLSYFFEGAPQMLSMTTDASGKASIVFASDHAGMQDFSYVIQAINYLEISNSAQAEVMFLELQATHQLLAEHGRLMIDLNTYDIHNQIVDESISVELYYQSSEGVWIYLKEFANTTSLDLSGVADYLDFRIIYSHPGYLELSYDIRVQMRNLVLEVNPQQAEYRVSFTPVLNLSSVEFGEEMRYELYYYDGIDWVPIGSFPGSIEILQLPGDYDIKIVFPGQLNYLTAEYVTTMRVNKTQTQVEFLDSDFYRNVSRDLAVLVTDADGDPLTNVDVVLVMDMILGVGTTDANGQAIIPVTIDLPIGEYELSVLTVENDYVAQNNCIIPIEIYQVADISYQIQEIIYTDGGMIKIQVSDLNTGDPVANASIIAKYKVFGDYKVLGSGTSDALGQLSIPVNGLEVGEYDIIIQFTDSELYGSYSVEGHIQVKPEQVQVLASINPLGITHGNDLLITVNDESGNITSGKVYWYIKLDGEVKRQGILELDYKGELFLHTSGDLIGEYVLELYYVDASGKFITNEHLSIDIGYEMLEESDIEMVYPAEIEFGTNVLEIQLHAHSIALDGILANISIADLIYQVRSVDGLISIQLDQSLSGTQQIELILLEGIYNAQISLDMEIEFLLGDESFDMILPESISIDSMLDIAIDDEYSTGASYQLIISRGDVVHYNMSHETTAIGLELLEILPETGEYSIAITRMHPAQVDVTREAKFQVTGIKVELKLSVVSNSENATIDVQVEATIEGAPVEMMYNLTVYTKLGRYSQIVPAQFSILVNGSGALDIRVEATGVYEGSKFQSINYDMGDTQDPVDEPENDGDVSAELPAVDSASMETAIVVILLIAGVVKTVLEKRKTK